MGQQICTAPPISTTGAEVVVETSKPLESKRARAASTESFDSLDVTYAQVVPVQLVQAEGHPSVRVYEAPWSGAKVINTIKTGKLGYLHKSKESFCMVSDGAVQGWVGAKNVRILPGGPQNPAARSAPKSDAAAMTARRAVDTSTGRPDRQATDRSVQPRFIRNTSGEGRDSTPEDLCQPCRPPPTAPGRFQRACSSGTRCKQRDARHLTEQAHPFDPEYADLCIRDGIQPEEPSIIGLFQWVDRDGSGKISRKELEEAMPELSKLFGESMVVTDKSWSHIDEDGNDCVNLSEFSCWAGPRLGLPLGVGHLFQGKAIDEAHGCAILGCPCEGFVPKEHAVQKITRKATERLDFSARLSGQYDGTGSQSSMLGQELARRGDRNFTQKFMSSAVGQERTQLCKCGHKFSAHRAIEATGEVPCPMYWDSRCISTGEFADLVELKDEHSLELLQDVFDRTYSSKFTRDRKKHHPDNPAVPRGFTVVRAFRSENSRIWREYGVKRAQLLHDMEQLNKFKKYDDVVSTLAWLSHGGALADRLKAEINEWYLFHGSSAESAEKICKNDFRLQFAGKCTGTLYGKGIYLAESVTKSDEYAKPNAEGVYTQILCRVIGGHAKYTDEVEPDPEDLVRACIEGPYDCIIGDRRKTRGTYREFVLYDSENVYAEYIIHYRRNF